MAYENRNYDLRQKRRIERERRRKKRFKITSAIILLLIIIAIVVCAILLSNPQKSDSDNTTTTNNTTQATETSTVAIQDTTADETTVTTEQTTATEAPTQPVNAEPQESKPYSDGVSVNFNKAETSKWYMKLANPWTTPLPKDYAPSLSTVQGYSVHSKIVKPLNAMISAAADDGINLYIVSGYRSYQRQETNFNNRVQQYINQGMTKAEAEKKTATIIAVPGTSEHHLGLALDFNSLDQNFANTKEGKWLAKNAYKYGFILRYEKDTTDITGIIYEPWHYRYVTVEHAKKIQEMDVTFEEYIDWLNSQG